MAKAAKTHTGTAHSQAAKMDCFAITFRVAVFAS